jgi:hypothetical protein
MSISASTRRPCCALAAPSPFKAQSMAFSNVSGAGGLGHDFDPVGLPDVVVAASVPCPSYRQSGSRPVRKLRRAAPGKLGPALRWGQAYQCRRQTEVEARGHGFRMRAHGKWMGCGSRILNESAVAERGVEMPIGCLLRGGLRLGKGRRRQRAPTLARSRLKVRNPSSGMSLKRCPHPDRVMLMSRLALRSQMAGRWRLRTFTMCGS